MLFNFKHNFFCSLSENYQIQNDYTKEDLVAVAMETHNACFWESFFDWNF